MDFRNKSGATFHTTALPWAVFLNLAQAFRWKPSGTLRPPGLAPSEEWAGGYDTNDGQIVSDDDAKRLAQALHARYSYAVNGMVYESTRWRFGLGPGGNMHAVTLASTEIKPVDPVVFYDPKKPSRSCLVVGIDETTLATAIIASVIGGTALAAGIR
jgi:hypothetical protein